MNTCLVRVTLAAMLCLGHVPVPGAEEFAQQYRAPSVNNAPRRVGGSPRGIPPGAPALPTVAALVPDHLGLTVSEQPTLFWYLSAPTDTRIELTLIQPGLETPLLAVAVDGANAGIRRLDLRDHDVRLHTGIEYEWSVALVPAARQRSRDIVSGGAIMRVVSPPGTTTTAEDYATAGLWYDALMVFEHNVREHPSDPTPRTQRAALLEQAGLAEVASFERR